MAGGSNSTIAFTGKRNDSQGQSSYDALASNRGLLAETDERKKVMAEVKLTGDINENHPDLRDIGREVSTEMATPETAVAVMEPILSGGPECAPVVPRDVLVFLPSYVPPEQLPRSSGSSSLMRSRLGKYMRDADTGQHNTIKIPSAPTANFFARIASNPEMKTAVCNATFRMIASKNTEVYGEETRANEVFLKECVSSGQVPEQKRSPQEMRDILKDRLITQVKRVVLLSEAIPGFGTLDTSDQHSLLRTCILDVWMVHSARFMRDRQSYILFLETNTYYTRRWMELFLTDEFLETVFEIASRINALDLSFDELALLKSILIVRPDRSGLKNVDYITVLHNHLLDSLKLAIRSRRSIESSQLLDDLMDLLKGWRILDVMQEKYVHPIDLSHFSQGPWKIDESTSSAASVASGPTSSPSLCSSPIPVITDTAPAKVNSLIPPSTSA